MPLILTTEDVVERIAAECTFVYERGAVGIRLEPARRDRAAIRRTIPGAAPSAAAPVGETAASPLSGQWRL
jgi:hypothetical protein